MFLQKGRDPSLLNLGCGVGCALRGVFVRVASTDPGAEGSAAGQPPGPHQVHELCATRACARSRHREAGEGGSDGEGSQSACRNSQPATGQRNHVTNLTRQAQAGSAQLAPSRREVALFHGQQAQQQRAQQQQQQQQQQQRS